MKKLFGILLFFTLLVAPMRAQVQSKIAIKVPGNNAVTYDLTEDETGELKASEELPVKIIVEKQLFEGRIHMVYHVKATKDCWFNLSNSYVLNDIKFDDSQFYLPGFWYKRNERSPEQAPNMRVSNFWTVREDRLTTPMTAVYDPITKKYFSVIRKGKIRRDALAAQTSGEVLLSGESELGFMGFAQAEGGVALRFGIPAWEAPKAYVRKLTLAPEVKNFLFISEGEVKRYTWETNFGEAADFGDFVSKAWSYSYDYMTPNFIANQLTNQEVKHLLSQFWLQSYTETATLKGFSGQELRVDQCETKPLFEVGFVGRNLLNAFNAYEYGESSSQFDRFRLMGKQVFDSYLQYGFNEAGYFREVWSPEHETDIMSIRRQSEGIYSILLFLNYEKERGRKNPEWEKKIKNLLDKMLSLQAKDHSFPRKFKSDGTIVDATGGSSACVVPTLAMAATYFKEKKYLTAAEKCGEYIEKEVVNKSDYFSSTLDANCEDKEAAIYTATAYYYLALSTQGKQYDKYLDLAKKAATFAATWYYLWDVPFAQGQMLGDMDFKSRGWGNVSVENNHIDVYAFDIVSVFDWLSMETRDSHFEKLALVMRCSMHEQLLPWPGHYCGVAKYGYHPEVVQHTNWDYGKNGKGFYNDIFAPGWVTASLWQMLMPDRAAAFFEANKKK